MRSPRQKTSQLLGIFLYAVKAQACLASLREAEPGSASTYIKFDSELVEEEKFYLVTCDHMNLAREAHLKKFRSGKEKDRAGSPFLGARRSF